MCHSNSRSNWLWGRASNQPINLHLQHHKNLKINTNIVLGCDLATQLRTLRVCHSFSESHLNIALLNKYCTILCQPPAIWLQPPAIWVIWYDISIQRGNKAHHHRAAASLHEIAISDSFLRENTEHGEQNTVRRTRWTDSRKTGIFWNKVFFLGGRPSMKRQSEHEVHNAQCTESSVASCKNKCNLC